jgi:hypothetical protein
MRCEARCGAIAYLIWIKFAPPAAGVFQMVAAAAAMRRPLSLLAKNGTKSRREKSISIFAAKRASAIDLCLIEAKFASNLFAYKL